MGGTTKACCSERQEIAFWNRSTARMKLESRTSGSDPDPPYSTRQASEEKTRKDRKGDHPPVFPSQRERRGQ